MLPIDLSEKLTSHKIIIVEDSGLAPGHGFPLVQALIDQCDGKNIHQIFTEFSPFVTPPNTIVDTPKEVLKEINEENQGLFIHSLTPLLINSSVKDIVNLLSKLIIQFSLRIFLTHFIFAAILASKSEFVFATIHGDCHPVPTLNILKNHSNLWLKVTSTNFKRTEFQKNHPKGKVEKILYDFEIDFTENRWKLCSVKPSSISNTVENLRQIDEAEILPSSTFNLKLSEKEKTDRSQVELPYLKQNSDKKESQIEYIPDENDDWDDEDPDDDLDF